MEIYTISFTYVDHIAPVIDSIFEKGGIFLGVLMTPYYNQLGVILHKQYIVIYTSKEELCIKIPFKY